MSVKEPVSIDQFVAMDLRIGKVVEASAPDWSEKLLELKVDFGEEIGQKTIFSGVKAFYQPEELIGKLFPFIINLPERKMGPSVSQGMMLMADGAKPVPLQPIEEVPVGSVIR